MSDQRSTTAEDLRPDEVAKQASELMREVIESVTAQSKDQHGATQVEGRLFFPSGIELISLRFKVGEQIDIHFQILGKDAPAKPDSRALMADLTSGEAIADTAVR